MAKGKATKAVKKSVGKSTPPAAKTKPSARPASTPAPPKQVAAPVAAAAEAAAPLLKKRNVKRGAPPMLPRRMARRPEPGAPGSVPPTPRPPSPAGSLHAPARAPEGAEGLKQRLGQVMTIIAQIRALKRTLNRQFFEAGLLLQKLSEPTLYQAKGYGTFDSFVEREIERELAIGRSLAHDLVAIVRLFRREAAEELGLERLRGALRALWPDSAAASSGNGSSG